MTYIRRKPKKQQPKLVKYVRINARTLIEVEASIPDEVARERWLKNQQMLNPSNTLYKKPNQ